MIRRPRRVVPATIVALVLLAAAVLTVWSCVQVLLGQAPVVPFAALAATAASLTWAAAPVLGAAGVLAVLGAVLLVLAVVPGRPTVLALADRDHGSPQPTAGATRRSVSSAVASAARGVSGIDRATAALSGRTVTATVHTPLHADPELTEQVRSAVTARLDDIAPARPLKVRVRMTAARSA